MADYKMMDSFLAAMESELEEDDDVPEETSKETSKVSENLTIIFLFLILVEKKK